MSRRPLFLAIFAVTVVQFAFSGEKVLYSFAGGSDGLNPVGKLAFDSSGNLYGVTNQGGASAQNTCAPDGGCGTVFELSRMPNGKWKKTTLYNFCPVAGCIDGRNPVGGVAVDATGNIYGVTYSGGAANGGVAFELVNIAGTWEELVMHHFCTGGGGCPDGLNPRAELLLDGAGNLWGTTSQGGGGNTGGGAGLVFEITPVGDGWVETVLYPFCLKEFCPDGAGPRGNVTFDLGGNLYTTAYGGAKEGTVLALSPNPTGYWTYSGLYDFCPAQGCLDGELPSGGVSFNAAGHLFGTATAGGTHGWGVVYELASQGGGTWQYSVAYDFCSKKNKKHTCIDGVTPINDLLVDLSSNIYGTAQGGGNDANWGGVVFKLTPILGGWKETVLHSFCKTVFCTDGRTPSGSLTFDSQGNLYGVTAAGGTKGGQNVGPGTVFEITP